MDISIIIPAYNEAKRISPTIQEILEYFTSRKQTFEVLIVNDGSQDDTDTVVKKISKDNDALKLINLEKNKGKGNAVREGVLVAQGDLILITDADGSSPINEIERLKKVLQASAADLVVGSRALLSSETLVEARPGRKLFGRIFNLLVNLIAVPEIKDTQCGFKLFKKRAAQFLFQKQMFPRYSFDVEILCIAHRAGLKISEVPINWHHVAGSKVNVIRDGIRMAFDTIKISLYYRRINPKSYNDFKN